MKKVFFGLVLSVAMFANDFAQMPYELDVNLFEKVEPQKVTILPYAHVEALIPGIGVCMRIPKEKFQIETNFKTANFPIILIGPLVNFYSGSVSVLPTIRSRGDKRAYFGVGVGIYYFVEAFQDERKSGPMAPLFLGYEGQQIFVDLGADMLLDLEENPKVIPVPTLRMGIKF